jgi:hypothetical protein
MAFERRTETGETIGQKIFFVVKFHSVEKKEFDKKLFTEAESPVPVIPTDQAWANMQRMLDKDMPAGAYIPGASKSASPWKGRLLALLGIIAAGFLVLLLNTSRNGENSKTGAAEKKTATGENKSAPAGRNAALGEKKSEVEEKTSSSPELSKSTSRPKPKLVSPSTNALVSKEKKIITSNKNSTNTKEYERNLSRNILGQHHDAPGIAATEVAGIGILHSSPNIDLDITMPTPLMDSLNVQEKDQQPPKKQTTWSGGLQWQLPVPVQGAKYYFAGPSGSSAPYLLLIPSAWISMEKNRHRVMLEVSPFQQALLPNKSFERDTDSTLGGGRYATLIKTFGYGASLQYAYRLQKNWWLGTVVQANWWRSALMNRHVDYFTGGSYDTTYKIVDGNSDWNTISSFQLKTGVELFYKQDRWSAGLQALAPVTSPFSNKNSLVKYPLQLCVLVRWQLLPRKL